MNLSNDYLPGEAPQRADYMTHVAEVFGLTADEVAEMDAERDAYEAAHPVVDAGDFPPADPWGMASEWVAVDGEDCDDLGVW